MINRTWTKKPVRTSSGAFRVPKINLKLLINTRGITIAREIINARGITIESNLSVNQTINIPPKYNWQQNLITWFDCTSKGTKLLLFELLGKQTPKTRIDFPKQ